MNRQPDRGVLLRVIRYRNELSATCPVYPDSDRMADIAAVSGGPESDSCSIANSANRVSSVIYHQARQRNFPISSVVVDAFGGQTLAGLNYLHRLDDSILH